MGNWEPNRFESWMVRFQTVWFVEKNRLPENQFFRGTELVETGSKRIIDFDPLEVPMQLLALENVRVLGLLALP